MKPRLITMPHSHYCEKARWALDLSDLEYVEEAHPPLFHMLATRKHGGRSVPILVHDGSNYTDSTDILLHLDRLGVDLYPREPAARNEVLLLEEEFDRTLGPHARRWAYAQLLPHSALLRKAMAPGATRVERALLPVTLPIIKRLIRKSLRISERSAARSLDIVGQVFGEVAQRLRDGRPYLVGDRFTAADLTFAALAGPVLLPAQYCACMPGLYEVSQSMRDEIVRLRQTTAGRYARRLFEQHRQPAPRRAAV